MIEVLRGVRAAEYQKLWSRIPRSLGTILWIIVMAALGWESGLLTGLVIVVALVLICRVIPSSSRPAELVVDVAYPTVMNANVVRLLWLALMVDLWLVWQRGPYSVLMVIVSFLLAWILPLAASRGVDRVARVFKSSR